MEIDLTLIVDYSKYHDVRVDNQFATDTLVPDVLQFQTLQDFDRWKQQGRLLHYKPAGFSKVYDKFKDPQGAWVASGAIAFSFMYDTATVGGTTPLTPRDLVDSKWKGKIASSYPHDDDAVLYLFTLYAQKYGWDWVAKFAAQDVQFGRGSNSPGEAVFGGQKAIGVGTAGSAVSTSPVTFVIGAGHPFMAWGQRTAVLKQAKNSMAAKLFLNWQLSTEMQNGSFNGWSVRTDVTPPGGPEADLGVSERPRGRPPPLHGGPRRGRTLEADLRPLLRRGQGRPDARRAGAAPGGVAASRFPAPLRAISMVAPIVRAMIGTVVPGRREGRRGRGRGS